MKKNGNSCNLKKSSDILELMEESLENSSMMGAIGNPS